MKSEDGRGFKLIVCNIKFPKPCLALDILALFRVCRIQDIKLSLIERAQV